MNTGYKLITIFLSTALAMALTACNDSDVPPGNNSTSILDGQRDNAAVERVEEADVLPAEYTSPGNSPARIASATLQPTQGNTASGLVLFIQPNPDDTAIRVVARVINITEGNHGFHIHEVGNCSAADASSAGDHFNPNGATHGAREGALRHAGDLGNLQATGDGFATVDFYDSQISFSGVNSIVGKAFIVHAMADDLLSQPSGNAGDRIACGVIEMKQSV